MKRLFFFGILVAVFAFVASAQTSRGTVSGIVADPTGAVVEGATVVLLNEATNIESTVVTNSSGFYRFDAVNLGNYSVSVTATGFGKVTKTGIPVSANQTSSVDVALAVGNQEVTVEITADAGAQLQTESAVRGGNITTQQITQLPVGANPVALALTLPGVSSNRGGFGVGTFSVNGARGRSNNFLIDGTENNDISVAGQGFQITNQDAVQEVSVQTGNYDSEFGRAGGAVVNVITRSGTSSFHGTLAFEYDTSADDAITAAQSRNPAVVARGRQLSNTQFVPSATFGGPLFLPNFGEGGPMFHKSRDRNFFFVGYEEIRFREPGGSVTLIVPTASGRAALQPFSGNPNVAAYLAATANTIAPLANRPTISLDRTGGPVVRGSVDTGTFFRTFSGESKQKQFQIRTDHTLTSKDQLTFRFLSNRELTPGGGTRGFEGFDADFASRYYNFLIAETHVFSSTQTNELRLAYNRIDLGFPIADASGPAGTRPFISVAGLSTPGIDATFPQGRIANNYQVQDTFTQILGDHTFRIGVDYLRQISTQTAPANTRGSLTYAAGDNFTPLGNFIDDFGGVGGAASRTFGSAVYNPTLHRIALFGHDRWKVTQSLSLSMGLRYEYFGVPFNSLRTPAFTGLFNVDPVTRTGPFSQANEVSADRNNVAPSVGFAWSPSYESGVLGFLFGEKKSVVRGGYNIGYDSFFNNIASNAVASSPNTIVTTNSSTASAGPRGLANFSNQFPTTAATVLPSSAQTLIAPNLVNPYYQRWSFGMQREVPLGIVFDVSYVGSKGTKLYINEDYNPLVRPEQRITPPGVTTGLTGRLDNLQGGRTVRTNGGDSNYHSGQLLVTRRFANHFQVTGAYTFAKTISNADEVFGIGIGSNTSFSAIPSVFGGQQAERALSSFHRAHRLSLTYVVQSPFFDKQRGVLGKVLGGFQLSGITTVESGVPYTVFNGFDADGVGGGLDRPTFNPNGQRGVRAVPVVNAQGFITSYINPEIVTARNAAGQPIAFQTIDPNTAQFIVNPAYVPGQAGAVVRIGNLGRNTEISNGINNFDMTVLKRTRLTERISIDLRAEFFNALNHPQFAAGPSVANAITQGQFLQAINPTSSGGGRVIRYQAKLVF